jgi:putative aldouronate transport system substrate-binding protein
MKIYVAEMTTRFITGREPLEQFDAYRRKLDQAGLPFVATAMQRALDRYDGKAVQSVPERP